MKPIQLHLIVESTMREENAVSAHFFVPLSLEADESLDRCAPKLYRYKELHNMIQHM